MSTFVKGQLGSIKALSGIIGANSLALPSDVPDKDTPFKLTF